MQETKEITAEDKDYEVFINGLYAVMMNLARETARDGEGATKLMECVVDHAPTEAVAKSVALSVINSSLLKAAIFAADANWGRILCAIGYAEGDFDISKVEVVLSSSKGSVKVCERTAQVLTSRRMRHSRYFQKMKLLSGLICTTVRISR